MKSKADLIRLHLKDLSVIDIGGSGYQETNAYERELKNAWSVCKKRICADYSDTADIRVDLNSFPLPDINESYDIATAFDVLEHLENPAAVLRWIPSNRLIVTLPKAMSCIARRMERQNQSKHLYSFLPYTASILLSEGGWGGTKIEYQFGKWSVAAKCINAIGSMMPSFVGTGIVLHCDHKQAGHDWAYCLRQACP